jgi:hypothetical protein
MNLLQLQTNFYGACLKYATDFAPVSNPDELLKANFIPNPDQKSQDDPNYLYQIVQWNHSSPQPTNDQLMQYTVDQAVFDYEADTVLPAKMIKIPKWTEAEKKRVPKRKLEEGDIIYNKTTKRLEIFRDDWGPLTLDMLTKQKTQTQTITANANTTIQNWDSADVVTRGNINQNAANGRFTVTVTGMYQIIVSAVFAPSTNGIRDIWIKKQNDPMEYHRVSITVPSIQTTPIRIQTDATFPVTAGTFIEIGIMSSASPTTLTSAQLSIVQLS